MENTLRYAVQVKKEKLINKMIQLGIYKKNNKHLYELTLSDLEEVYKGTQGQVHCPSLQQLSGRPCGPNE